MDSDLVVRAQRGDKQAFEAIVLQSHTRLQALAIGILRDPHLAEDAVQQAGACVGRPLSCTSGWDRTLSSGARSDRS